MIGVLGVVACSSSHGTSPDAGGDAGFPVTATGTHLVDHPAVVGGITSDNYVAYYDTDADGHTVAEIIPLAGGTATPIATSSGSGKIDIRFETVGPVVFAWTDRGDRMSTLTMWSAATGPIAVGPGVRPGRAGATADGTQVLYETAVTATSANVVAGPIAGTPQLVGSANASDNDCWQDTDLTSSGSALFARFCPGTATAFSLVTVAGSAATLSTDAIDAYYGSSAIVWLEASGTLATATAVLATDATQFSISPDETTAAWLTGSGAIYLGSLGSAAPELVVAAPLAKQLGAISPDDQTVLFASQVVDMGSGYVQPYTDVLEARPGMQPIVLVPQPTSCPSCMFSSFTPDGAYALVLDPIDNSEAADAAGPIHAFATADGTSVGSFGSGVYSAVAVRGTSLIALDAVRASSLETGWAYGITLRASPEAGDTVIAQGAENFTFDASLEHAIASFSGSGSDAGIWVAPIP